MEMNECEFDFVLNDHFLLSMVQTDREKRTKTIERRWWITSEIKTESYFWRFFENLIMKIFHGSR